MDIQERIESAYKKIAENEELLKIDKLKVEAREEKREALHYEVEVLKDMLEQEHPKTWPQDGDDCYELDTDGEIICYKYSSSGSTKELLVRGNLYKTEEEAEAADRLRIAETKVIRRLREIENPEEKNNYFPRILGNSSFIPDYYSGGEAKTHLPTWYSTEAAWFKVWNEMPEAIKTMLGVE